MLRMFGGSASAVKIADYVMNIRKPEPSLARALVKDICDRDPRLQITDDTIELVQDALDARRLMETDFVVFDLETTGAKAPPCRITEIGAFRISRGVITEKFHTLVNPEIPIPPFITALTGISDSMVRDAPLFADIADELLEFLDDSILVAHNAPFDMHFLNHEISRSARARRLLRRDCPSCDVELFANGAGAMQTAPCGERAGFSRSFCGIVVRICGDVSSIAAGLNHAPDIHGSSAARDGCAPSRSRG